MSVNRISLVIRLDNLKNGYAANPEFNQKVIETFSSIPVCNYMASFEEENERLREILGISEEEEESLTYRDIACEINLLYRKPQRKQETYEAMRLLTLPFKRCYEERKKYYG